MTQTPRRRPATAPATMTVGYPPGADSRQWEVPIDVYRAGEAKAWIEQQLAYERDRKAAQQQKVDDRLAQEFTTIKQGLGQLDAMRDQITMLEQALASYKAADEARQVELTAVRSAADEAIGVGTNAVATTRDLSVASTQAADLLDRLRTTADDLETRLERVFEDYDRKVALLEAQAVQLGNTIRNQERAFQELVSKLEDKVAAVELKVNKADVTAQDALTTAQAAQRANRNGNDIQAAADSAGAQAMQQWETSSDTATIRRLLGTDARSLEHLSTALKAMKDQAQEIGGTSVQDAALIADRLIERIRQAQDFQNGFGQEYSFEPDTPNGRGGAAKSAEAAGRGPNRPVLG